jgi:hypothetical protein
LNRTAALLAAEADRAEKLNRLALKQLMEEADTETPQTPRSRIVLERAGFLQQDVATQRGVLRSAWRLLNAPSEALTFEQVENVRQLLATTRLMPARYPLRPPLPGVLLAIDSAYIELRNFHYLHDIPF